jgi:hypothetical protein
MLAWVAKERFPCDRHRTAPRMGEYHDRYDDGDLCAAASLVDTRRQPLPHAGATVPLDRSAVVIPPGTAGPVAGTAAVYYPSCAAVVAT